MPQADPVQLKAEDTCVRCGLRRLTRALEERGVTIRLCDDCYWGKGGAGTDSAGNTISAR